MTAELKTPTRFAFGDNWRAFLEFLDEARIVEAEASVRRLLGRDRLDGIRLLDIGSGSGLFSLAARRLGANVFSFDFDPASVNCTRILRERHFGEDTNWAVRQGSVLDPAYMNELGFFDVVYSWGVLHHTGAMYTAIRNAAARVKPDGLLVFALYRKTYLCVPWTLEKRWYAKAPANGQLFARTAFKALLRLYLLLQGKSYADYIKSYRGNRGMNFEHDLHDWMGGYPYESISPAEVASLMRELGFSEIRTFVQKKSIGFFGSGCDEYVYGRAGG